MSFADRTEKLVPYLRRYARAATGNTQVGDAAVEAVLEAVLTLSLESDFEPTEFDREGLYRLLDQELDAISNAPAAKARRALLLIAVERLPSQMACRILGVRPNVLTEMLELAERDFAQTTATRMLIIEDEPLIAAQLKRIAQGLGHTVVGIAMTATEAVALGRAHEPDIILCDIHLQGGSLGTDARQLTAFKLSRSDALTQPPHPHSRSFTKQLKMHIKSLRAHSLLAAGAALQL